MSLSQDGGNELWREIKKNDPAHLYRYSTDWSAVKRIASLKPELLNTVSSSGWTTLMQAAWWHCSNEVIIFMMKKAAHKTLVTKNDHNFSLQHALAKSCLVSATRELLTKTKIHINLRTTNFNSPLHMCMYENDIKFEDRVGTIKVLLENGADITAINKDGLTPIEKCLENISKYSGYSEDRKQELLCVLRGEEIPSEILARGPDAQKHYQNALEEGQSDYNFVRVMVMGQESVGKTCLIDSLLGKDFNETHIITDAIAVTRSCVCDEADNTKWKPVDSCQTEIKDKHENVIATNIAQSLKTKKEGVSSQEYTEVQSQTNGQHSSDLKRKLSKDVDENCVSAGENKRSKTQTSGATSQATTPTSSREADAQPQITKQYSQDMEKKVVQVMEGASIIDNSFKIWDYGGQPIYHTIHRFYMTPEGIFVMVFNIADDLDACPIVVDSFGNEYKYYLTNLEHLLYWIRSSYTYARDDSRPRSPDYIFPVCIIVGTHRNSLKGSEEEIRQQVEEKFDKIRKAIEDKCYEAHVYEKYFAVENQLSSSDENISELKKIILDIKDKMKYPIPHKWLELLIAIQELSKEHVTLPLAQVKSMASKCGISDQKTIDIAITYFNDVGEIMYHPTEEALQDIVVVRPLEIVKYVKTVFTAVKPELRKSNLEKDWSKLDKGVLTKRLLQHLWKKFPIFQNDTDEKMYNFFVALMNKFGLICQKQNTGSGEITYYAVSHLQRKNHSVISKVDLGNDNVSIFHDFCGFLPDHLFQLAVTKFIEKFQPISEVEPKLEYEDAELSIDACHFVKISVVTVSYRRMFKTTIVRIPQNEESSCQEPMPETCKRVLLFLQSVLDSLCKTSTRGIQYKMCVPCSCSDRHMIFVDNFNKKAVQCGLFEISIERYYRLFGDASTVSESSRDIQCPLNEVSLLDICKDLGPEWKHLGYHLGMSNPEIDRIIINCRNNLKDAQMEMLLKWRNRQPNENQISVLSEALRKVNYVQIADRLNGIVGRHSDILHGDKLMLISESLGTKWKSFGVLYLGMEWEEMRLLEEQHQGNPLDACMDMLVLWRRKQSVMTNQVDIMSTLLKKHGFPDAANKLSSTDVDSMVEGNTVAQWI